MAKNKSNYNKKSNNYYRKNYNNKNKRNKSYNKKLNNTGELNLNDLETTTRIRIDDERLNDTGSLDTSFLEGRFSNNKKKKKIIKDTKPIKYTSMENRKKNTRIDENKPKKSINKTLIISIFIIVVIGCLLVFGLFAFYSILNNDTNKNEKIVSKKVVDIKNDENIVFFGDSITDGYDLDKYYEGYHVVNSGYGGNRTTDLLKGIKDRVYIYNPSKVFILIGTNDLVDYDTTEENEECYEEIVGNIEKIVKKIKKNRKYAEIYLESIYPISNIDDEKIDHGMVSVRKNRDIKNINERLKKLAIKEKISYIDLYSKLIGDDGNIKLEYTTEGLHISDEGYEVVTEELLKYINDEK